MFVHRAPDGKVDGCLSLYIDDGTVSANELLLQELREHLAKKYAFKHWLDVAEESDAVLGCHLRTLEVGDGERVSFKTCRSTGRTSRRRWTKPYVKRVCQCRGVA